MHSEELGTAPLVHFGWDYLMILITLLVLYLILRKFFFEKIKAFMDNRRNEIQKEYDDADLKFKESEELREKYEIKVQEIENSRRNIIKNAKKEGEKRAKNIVDLAYVKSENIIKDAERRAKRELEKAEEQMKTEIATLAIVVSEKILKQSLTKAQKEKYLNDIRF